MSLLLRVKALAEAVGADIKSIKTDPRLTNSREWTGSTVSQAEAEAGTASTRRAWTAQRVRQAINAWWQLVTSGFGRNLVAATNEQAARNALQLSDASTASVFDIRNMSNVVTPTADPYTTYRATVFGSPTYAVKVMRIESALGLFTAFSPTLTWSTNDTHAYMAVDYLNASINIGAGAGAGILWNADLYHTANLLNIGTTAATARTALGLGYAATAPTVGDGDEVMLSGAYGWGATTDTPIAMDANLCTTSGVYQGGGPDAINFAVFGNFGTLTVTRRGAQVEQFYQIGNLGAATRNSFDEGVTWSAWVTIYNSFNQLDIGITPASARAALELTGEWVDLRPYLKPPFYWKTSRETTNPYPRIRKLSCGRVELDGVVSIDANTALIPIGGAFVNVPAPFRPTLTSAGVIFADTVDPLFFGYCNWIVAGEVQYGGNGVHGDVNLIGLGLPTPFTDGALSLNGIYWFT